MVYFTHPNHKIKMKQEVKLRLIRKLMITLNLKITQYQITILLTIIEVHRYFKKVNEVLRSKKEKEAVLSYFDNHIQ